MINWQFQRAGLLTQALTHSSYRNEHPQEPDNERLEFLGDSLIEFLVTEALCEKFPEWPEGTLSRCRDRIVREDSLAQMANVLKLGGKLRLGVGEAATGGRTRPRVLADAMEAVVAAVFLDGGIAAAKQVFLPLLKVELEKAAQVETAEDGFGDARSKLQTMMQKQRKKLPEYIEVRTEGPDHARRFVMEVVVDGQRFGPLEGSSKQSTIQKLAALALRTLSLQELNRA